MRLGLFGGTFDPIHHAHLFVAEAARVSLGLDRVLFLPTRGTHYRVAPLASLEDRTAMIRAAIAPNPSFALDLTDTEDAATGFTADLLPRLAARHPASSLTFVAGADSVLESLWQRFDEVLACLETFVVAPRGNEPPGDLERWRAELPPQQRFKVRLLDAPALTVSATLVRTEISRGASIRYLVPDAVAAYLAAYRPYDLPETPDAP